MSKFANRVSETRYEGLAYTKICPGYWSFVSWDVLSGETKDKATTVGAHYRTKEELLADLIRYAEFYGCPLRA